MYQPRYSPSQNAVRGTRYPRLSFEEFSTIPFHFAQDFPLLPQTPLHLLVLDNGMTRELRPRQIIHEPPPRFIGQQNVQVSRQHDNESRLTQDEQKKVLKQLKVETYNPTPKKLLKRLSLYYRGQANNIVSEKEKEIDEDGKRCAVCLEDFEPKELVMLTPCKHMFHEECIVPWVMSHGQCPVCRFSLSERIRRNAAPLNNTNFENVAANDQLISIITAMEEALIWGNRAR